MDDFRFLPIFVVFILNMLTVGHTFPFLPNDVDVNIESTFDIKGSNITAEKHSLKGDHNTDSNLSPGCRIEYKTYYEVLEEESTRQECNTEYENRCTTKTKEKCTPWTDNVCTTKYRQKCRNWSEKKCTDSWRDECSQQTKEECNDNTRPVQVPYEEDECVTTQEKRCEKHWEEPIKGKKVWVDNPATCKYYDATECNPVTKYRTEQEKYTKCEKVPYQHCDKVKDTNCIDVPRQKCEDEPWQDCRDVQKQRCQPESWEDCQDYPKQVCKNIHAKIPRQVTKQVPIRVCGSEREVYNVEANFKKSSDLGVESENNNSDNEVEEDAHSQEKLEINTTIIGPKIGLKPTLKGNKEKNAYAEDEHKDDIMPFMFGEK